ncbi:MAG TPA: polysaccharide deacetylase family protein [Acidimicrobiales bacterium]|nr:polysaccharide deacetylase family protein [Acidimicrobiales bacterium]
MNAARGALALTAAAAAAYAAPSVARLLPPRWRATPHLSGVGDPRHVALTFDDGPDPASTPAVMDALAELGWHATFFLLGNMTSACPGLAADLVAAGHEVAVHGWSHAGAIRRSPGWLADDVRRCRDAVFAATGMVPYWYRPPFGELSLGTFTAARANALRVVLWTAWGRDWRPGATPTEVVADIERGVLAGGTVLLHDSDCTSAPGSWRVTVAALPLLAERLAELGLKAGTLSEHTS